MWHIEVDGKPISGLYMTIRDKDIALAKAKEQFG